MRPSQYAILDPSSKLLILPFYLILAHTLHPEVIHDKLFLKFPIALLLDPLSVCLTDISKSLLLRRTTPKIHSASHKKGFITTDRNPHFKLVEAAIILAKRLVYQAMQERIPNAAPDYPFRRLSSVV
jgi:hypothetical protein